MLTINKLPLVKRLLLAAITSGMLLFIPLKSNPALAQIDTASMDSFNIQLDNARFKKSQVFKLNIIARGLNFAEGKVDYLTIMCLGFQDKNIILDKLTLTLNNVNFDPENLFSKQQFLLSSPVDAKASVILTETSINSFLNSPKTLENLSQISKVKIKKFGLELNSGLISFIEPHAKILPNDTLQIDMLASLGNMINFPVRFSTRLAIANNNLILASPLLNTSGMDLPPEVAQILNAKLNQLIAREQDKIKDDAEISVTSIETIPGTHIALSGKALIKKLKFGKKSEIAN